MKEYKITGTVGGIFISYANEDKYIALPLYHRLKERYNVWMDERLEAADGYDIRIQNAINSCTVFMPILSSQVKSDLKANKQRYYRQEWQWAQDHYDAQRNANAPNMMKFIPILIGSYDIRGDYHQRVPECLKVVTAFNLREKSIDELFEILNRIKL